MQVRKVFTLIDSTHSFFDRWRSGLQQIYAWLITIFEGKQSKNTIAPLDGIRALACLMVITYHVSLITTKDRPLWNPTHYPVILSALIFACDMGVTLFFILSGFLLFLPYAKALLFDAPWPSMRQFYIRRALRILPAYYVTLLLMILLYDPEYLRPDHLTNTLLFLTLFMDSSTTTFKAINGPFWSLAVEWQFYLLLPFLALGMRLFVRRGSLRWRIPMLILCLCVLVAAGLLTRHIGLYVTQHPGETFTLPPKLFTPLLALIYGLPTNGLHGKFLEDFAIGMAISSCYIFLHARPGIMQQKLQRSLLLPGLLLCGLVWLVIMCLWKYNIRYPHIIPFFDSFTMRYSLWSELGFSLGFGICIFAILFGPTILQNLFSWRLLRWLGLLSFGLYMWHLKLLEDFNQHVLSHVSYWNRVILYGSFWIWLLVVIVPCMFLLFLLVERPGMQLGNRFRTKTSTRSTVQAENTRQPQVETSSLAGAASRSGD